MSRKRTESTLSAARRAIRYQKRKHFLRDRYWSDPEYRERLREQARDRARERRAAGEVLSKTIRCPICEAVTGIASTRAFDKGIERSRWCPACRLEIRTCEVIVELVHHGEQPSADGALVEAAS